MARDDDDTWGVEESVGATALGTAAVRAFEGATGAPLFSDPFAQHFLDAAAQRGYEGYGGVRPEDHAEADPALAEFVLTMTNFAAVRTKSFDDVLTEAAEAGLTQFVILAAGLDTRAWRLPQLAHTTIFELDQPGVLRFKGEVLEDAGAHPIANYVPVPIDLRQDWPQALRDNGFDPSEPTCWSVEGLLPYLPPQAQHDLFERVHTLSAAGSRLVVDAYRPEFYGEATLRTSFDQMDRATRPEAADERIYREEMFFTGERTDVADWLATHGWSTSSVRSIDAMSGCDRPAAPSVDPASLSSDFVTARLPDASG